MARLLDMDRTTTHRAEQELAEIGLVAFDGGRDATEDSRRQYRILLPVAGSDRFGFITPTQRQGWYGWMDFPDEVADKPANTPAGESTPAPAKQSSRETLTPEMREWFLSSPDNLSAYLRFGVAAHGLTAEQWQGLPSQATDWLAHKPADPGNPFTKHWSIPQFAAYYWDGASRWRAKNNHQLTFPNWGRLTGEVKNLVKTTTPFQAYAHLFRVVHHFDLIRFLIGRLGPSLMLDEASPNHALVKQQAHHLAQQGDPWVAEQYERMAEAYERGMTYNAGSIRRVERDDYDESPW
jgi:hypothetical protein